jgi:carbonic anhydrase/acetyltransferase-like protein (isoleucine patch superfamily)
MERARSHSDEPRIDSTARLKECRLGRHVSIGERVMLRHVTVGDYSYFERGGEAIYADIGKFCSIAANCRINALEHPMERLTTHKVSYRPNEYFVHAKLDGEFRERRRQKRVSIGHDVWIGHGAVIMPGIRSEGVSAYSWRLAPHGQNPLRVNAGILRVNTSIIWNTSRCTTKDNLGSPTRSGVSRFHLSDQFICMAGRRTGWVCGHTVYGNWSGLTYQNQLLLDRDTAAQQGDSGGPVVMVHIAVAILSAASDVNNPRRVFASYARHAANAMNVT